MVVGLDPQLKEILRCPCPDHGELRSGTAADSEADALTCIVCARSFPVIDGIPVMLLDQALAGTGPAADQIEGDQGRASELDSP
jgi:uncharacterized protein YbaR (Trm112 family)